MANIRVGSAVMVEKDGKLLLGRRGKEPDYGALIIPGGGVNIYEDFADAARREIREESGCEIKNLRQFGVYQIINPDKENHRVIIYWRADWAGGTPAPSSDLLSARFYTREELRTEAASGNLRGVGLDVLRDAGWL
ncbi:MAG: NUDIX domain-containing protein [Proteobacteria bacterium]|nr:NUDIX domain-containing protein [Pseudomonadota bacterium]